MISGKAKEVNSYLCRYRGKMWCDGINHCVRRIKLTRQLWFGVVLLALTAIWLVLVFN